MLNHYSKPIKPFERFKPFLYFTLLGVFTTLFVSCALFESKEVSHGKKLFSFYCAACHGEKGNGKGFNADNLDPHPRDLTDAGERYMADASNDDIFNAIKKGLSGVVWDDGSIKPAKVMDEEYGFGSTLMPYWGSTLSDDEIWSLVAFIRTLHKNDAEKVVVEAEEIHEKKGSVQKPVNVDFDGIQNAEKDRLVKEGAYLINEKYACMGCHKINGEGGEVGPDLSRAGKRFNSKWIYRWIQYASSIKKETKMPDFAMPDQDALAITLYLKTLQADIPKAEKGNSGKSG
ncbi:MAG TPA: cytochrome c [Nitrospiria bacterium]|jgi:mono/diheme cytochrome c family protein